MKKKSTSKKRANVKGVPGWDTPVKARLSSMNPRTQSAQGMAPSRRVTAGGTLTSAEREAIKMSEYGRRKTAGMRAGTKKKAGTKKRGKC